MRVERGHCRQRLLALEVRPQEFGFIVFEGTTRIMDWGTRMAVDWQNRKRVVALKAIRRLLDFYRPPMIVLHRNGSSVDAIRVATIIRAEARRRSVQCQTVAMADVGRFFAALGCTTKHEIASLIAEWFAELSWVVPPKRKPWQSESRHTLIFDAAAVGVVFLATSDQEAA